MIHIIDYGMGNLGSIQNMLKKLGYRSVITNSKEELLKAEKLILPGVGSFQRAMENIEKLGLIDVLNKRVLEDKVPVLGICLGMQLLGNGSEEGEKAGLGWIDADILRFQLPKNFKVPHMGWNLAKQQKENPVFADMYEEPRFYFVHTYYMKCNDESDILTTTNYGGDFASSVAKENITGAQFHPEKSHKFGMKLLGNFAEL